MLQESVLNSIMLVWLDSISKQKVEIIERPGVYMVLSQPRFWLKLHLWKWYPDYNE